MSGAALDPAHRRHVHDRARAAWRHEPGRRAGAEERAVEVDGKQAPPLFVAQPNQRVQRRPHAAGERLEPLGLQQWHDAREMGCADRSCVVDKDVDGAELALHVRERGFHGVAVADVGVDREAVADGGDGLPRRVEPEVESRDSRALGREAVADRLADARAAAGDDGDPALEPHAARSRSGTATSRPWLPPAASRS
jgi:hypothetical protein